VHGGFSVFGSGCFCADFNRSRSYLAGHKSKSFYPGLAEMFERWAAWRG
jgi:hypothetical protein